MKMKGFFDFMLTPSKRCEKEIYKLLIDDITKRIIMRIDFFKQFRCKIKENSAKNLTNRIVHINRLCEQDLIAKLSCF